MTAAEMRAAQERLNRMQRDSRPWGWTWHRDPPQTHDVNARPNTGRRKCARGHAVRLNVPGCLVCRTIGVGYADV